VHELCGLLPEWVQTKDIAGTRYLKVVNQGITSQKIYETLKAKILTEAEVTGL
jgi:hypothetical protein